MARLFLETPTQRRWLLRMAPGRRRRGFYLFLCQYVFCVWAFSFFNEPLSVMRGRRSVHFCSSIPLVKDGSPIPNFSYSPQALRQLSMSASVAQKVTTKIKPNTLPPETTLDDGASVRRRLRAALGADVFSPPSLPAAAVAAVEATPAAAGPGGATARGAFLHLRIDERHESVASWSLGRLAGPPHGGRLLALHRHKMWWMKPAHVASGRRVPAETQLLLAELPPRPGEQQPTKYCVLVPLIDGNAKCNLRGLPNDVLQLRAETGDASARPEYGSLAGLYVGVGDDPFHLLQNAFGHIAARLREKFGLDAQEDGEAASAAVAALKTALAGGGGGAAATAATDPLVAPYSAAAAAAADTPAAAGAAAAAAAAARSRPAVPAVARPPAFLDGFGWCTWDSFYTQVCPAGVRHGLRSLRAAGFAPRWLVLDDGWQSTSNPHAKNEEQWMDKLTDLRANAKFRDPEAGTDLGDLVREVKRDFGVKEFLVWHALAGYWAGVERTPALEKYAIVDTLPHSPEKLMQVDRDLWKLTLYLNLMNKKQGMVHPDHAGAFYEDYHRYLAEQGVDGIKVDAQSIVNVMGNGLGGSVKVAAAYHKALQRSSMKHFSGRRKEGVEGGGGGGEQQQPRAPNLIHCMCHDSEILLLLAGLYEHRPLVRGSDDHYPRDPASHGPHLYFNAFNALLVSFVGLQDWDMFQTALGPGSWLHGAARAVSGGPVYVSDRPGEHDADLLRRLVLPGGGVLRSAHNALPVLGSLFEDPQAAGARRPLAVWNTHATQGGAAGVLGLFHVAGAGWHARRRKFAFHPGARPGSQEAEVRPSDVHSLACAAHAEEEGEGGAGARRKYALYFHAAGRLAERGLDEPARCAVAPGAYEVVTVVRAAELMAAAARPVRWAPVGLPDMFNSGAAVLSQEVVEGEAHALAAVRLRGEGRALALCSRPPRSVFLVGPTAAPEDTANFEALVENWGNLLAAGKVHKLAAAHRVNAEGVGELEYHLPPLPAAVAEEEGAAAAEDGSRLVVHIWDDGSAADETQ